MGIADLTKKGAAFCQRLDIKNFDLILILAYERLFMLSCLLKVKDSVKCVGNK